MKFFRTGQSGITETTPEAPVKSLKEARERIHALEQENNELLRREQLKDDFISIVGHELRSAGAAIKNVISNALAGVSGTLPDKMRQSLVIADDNLKRFNNTINDLLDISKLESGRLVLYRSLIDPFTVTAGIVESYKSTASDQGIELALEWTAPRTMVFMDENRFGQILVNLLGNALKFTPQGGRIIVRGLLLDKDNAPLEGLGTDTPPPDACFALQVQDTGSGIDPERLAVIFNRYEQASSEILTPGTGLGLGLAISKQLVEVHDGKIWVTSEKGNGSTFAFTLPLLDRERVFREALADRVHAATIHHYPVALLIFQVDRKLLKENDTAGQIEALLQRMMRRMNDTSMWLGDERFAVILPQTTVDDGKAVLTRIAAVATEEGFTIDGKDWNAAVKGRVIGFPDEVSTYEQLLEVSIPEG